jgi:hypothetical protein
MVADSRRNATSRLRRTVARYRHVRRSLHTPASWQSRYGLDWTNFRAALLVFTPAYAFMIVVQFLDGINGAIINVLTVLVITDVTAGTGRFNLAQGAVGAMIGIAASVSTLATGFLVQGLVRSNQRIPDHQRRRSGAHGLAMDLCSRDQACGVWRLTPKRDPLIRSCRLLQCCEPTADERSA